MSGLASRFPAVARGSTWLSVSQMREVDRMMVEDLVISLVRMTENAGRSVVVLARHLLGTDPTARRVLVLAGPGGNGGGGLVAARHLLGANAEVTVRPSHRLGHLATASPSARAT